MSDTEDKKRKSGRTEEQQAARDARKAAKKAAKAAAAGEEAKVDTVEEDIEEGGDGEKKRKRSAQDEADLLEIDMKAEAPMSKAEMRAARKRVKRGEEPLPPKKSAGQDEKPEEDSEGNVARAYKAKADQPKPQPKGEYSIWVGNLSFRTTADSLKEFIQRGLTDSGGEDEAITRVHMPKKAAKGSFAENKGFAYVDFKTEALRLLALGLSERPLDGRRLLIKAGDDHRANPEARTAKPLPSGPGTMPNILSKQKHGESSTIFIGNLPFDVTEDELRDLVEGNADEVAAEEEEDKEDEEEEEEAEGEEGDEQAKPQASNRAGRNSGLVKTRVAQFEDTGRCKGFAFWDFKSPAHAKAALLNRKNHNLRGRRLNLQFASEEATKRAGGRKREPREQNDRPRFNRERGDRPAKRPRYFDGEGGEGDAEEGGYEARSSGAGYSDFKSESAAASRIAAMVAGDEPERPERSERPERRHVPGKKWEATGRPRPGAALAMAKREKVGIVESSGSKIVFD